MIMRKSFSLIILASLCGIVFPGMLKKAVAQQSNIDTLKKKFDHYRKQNLQEKIYLHIDRPSYLTGGNDVVQSLSYRWKSS